MIMKILLKARAIFLLVYLIVVTPILSVLLLMMHFLLRSRRVDDWIIRETWARPFMKMTGAKIELRGLHNLKSQKNGALLLFNHTSWIDIFVLFATLDPLPRFGAKIELFKVPFFGAAMRAVGILPIARDQREKVMQVYDEAAERAKQGEVFALAPEGTRQKEKTLGPFKKGPFLFALRTPMPIIPTVIAGALDVMPKDEWLIAQKRGRYRVIVEFLPMIETKGRGDQGLDEVQSTTFEKMRDCYTKLLEELG